MSRALGSIERLRVLWQDETSPAARRAGWAILGGGAVAAAHVGRLGHDWSRAAAAALFIVTTIPMVARWMARRRHEDDPRAVMRDTILRTQPDLANAALRALELREQTEAEPARGSIELAQHHFLRLLGRASLSRVGERASRYAWAATLTGLLIAIATLGAVTVDPFRVVEGLDVIAARDGFAPVPMRWVDLPRFVVEPPSYLQMARTPIRPFHPTALHVGTSLSINALPIHDGRELVLTDGNTEVGFHADGEGAMVARWTITEDAELRIAARFGDVLVPEPLALRVDALADHAPVVRLEGAPDTLRLLDTPAIPIHWQAQDDHGIREVALVLRAGEREVRRELSKPQGAGAMDRGGIELKAEDPFLDKSFLPIEVTVQALDNDPISGPKWGSSAALILLPPQIGEREAMRYTALATARDSMTDLLASRLSAPSEATGPERRAREAHERVAQRGVVQQLEDVLEGEWGGLTFRGRLAALARGQIELLNKATKAWEKSPTAKTRQALVRRTENVLLALDSAVGALGFRDTRASALKLAEVAADAASAIEQTRDGAGRRRAERRFHADLGVLERSAPHLMVMGSLGRDLGEIVENDLRRINRTWERGDRYHARLAAEDLAARLRQPDPSFGAAGGHGHGGGSSGGVESGGGQGSASEGEASQAAEESAELERALEELRQDHAEEMREVDEALRDAMSDEAREQLEEKMRDAARQVRDAVRELPRQASREDSSQARAAQGRSEAEAAASELDKGEAQSAMERAKQAMQALRDAERKAREAPAGSAEREMGEEAGKAAGKLGRIMKDAAETMKKAQAMASEGAKGRLDRSATRERQLAERARDLRRSNESGQAPLPGNKLDRLADAAREMEEAAKRLERGKGNAALDKQRQAQRLLEMAQPESEQEPSPNETEGDGRDFARDADVPGEGRDERADAFRRRVTDGLGRDAPPHLREALKRYTEGLLR
jgi:hypothetical protein